MEITFNLGDPRTRGRGWALRWEGEKSLGRGVAGCGSEGRGARSRVHTPRHTTPGRRVGGGEGAKGGDGSVAGAAKREEWPNRRGVSSGPPGPRQVALTRLRHRQQSSGSGRKGHKGFWLLKAGFSKMTR